jgi:PTH1 family peptidyl-tRNA hydrolase
LGNPGSRYEATRHNMGREVVKALAEQHKTKFGKETDGALLACVHSFFGPAGETLCMAIFPCFMNESGHRLASLLGHRDISPQEIIVVADDFSLPFGTLRLRKSGSSGGHKGLQSIIDVLQTEDFPRLRVGIGPVPPGQDPVNFVLESFTSQEKKLFPDLVKRASLALTDAARDFASAMNTYNRPAETK